MNRTLPFNKTAASVMEKAHEALDKKETILEEAGRLVTGDRQASYGPPDQDFARTAGMWNAYLGLPPGTIRPQDVACMMIQLKTSRQKHQNKRDNWVDIGGYAYCGNTCMECEDA